ncbi:MAG: rhodanese-like domain-containing protein [Bdellovibrionaceae bacterium]|jgi:phage shock protein E|nr:rhodanese-like domain-containing protein [Pseudobdellovibrionaceae bacterium]
MKKVKLTLVFMIVIFSVACTSKSSDGVKNPVQIKKKASPAVTKNENGEKSKATAPIIIDVRTMGEWNSGHVKGALHIPLSQVSARLGEIKDKYLAGDFSKKVIVYCAVGARASRARRILQGAGFTNVENGGGFSDMTRTHEAEY